MPELSVPDLDVHRSFLEAVQELAAEGRGAPGDRSSSGRQIRAWSGTWERLEGFRLFLEQLRAESDPERCRLDGTVASTTWWWVEGDEYLGRIALRHRLTDELLQVGGHIGYEVRPSARRRGHATAMLAAVLPLVHGAGVESVLVTCDVSNVASRKVIQANGGVFEDERRGKLRFWIPELPGPHTSVAVRYELPGASALTQPPITQPDLPVPPEQRASSSHEERHRSR